MDNSNIIQRGDMYYAQLDPVKGSEQGGMRPVIIIQNNIGNKFSPTVIVVPVTSQSKKTDLPTHVVIDGCKDVSYGSMALLEQIKTIDKTRLGDFICHLDKDYMKKIDSALMISCGLSEVKDSRRKMEMCLCPFCVRHFRDVPNQTVRRKDYQQEIKEVCTFCNIRMGYDYVITDVMK